MALLHTLPADDGFSMPAEFDEQQAVVMILSLIHISEPTRP